jgi:hypothetical protein
MGCPDKENLITSKEEEEKELCIWIHGMSAKRIYEVWDIKSWLLFFPSHLNDYTTK